MEQKPVLLAVDDEPQVLNAVERDLRRHFQGRVRLVKAGSGAEALEALKQLKSRGAPVALFLVDQRMPGMSGTEFLREAMRLFPEARKVLLTAYADTQAAITSINEIGLDHYLLKPWDPPEAQLFPVLDELLEEWEASVPAPWDGLRVLGTRWSAPSHALKDFLARNRVPYRWVDLDQDAAARAHLESLGEVRLPTVILTGGEVLPAPDRKLVAARLGMQSVARERFYDLAIIGGGPGGLAAAVYGASEGLRTVLIEKEATGGQAGTSSRIENYLGFPRGTTGAELARRAHDQAVRFGTEILLPAEVERIRVEEPYRILTLADGSEISCYAVVVATGVSVRRLDVPGADALTGAGVYYGAALTEAALYRDEPVFVVGGANSAGQGAMLFARYASSVTMLVRGDGLKASMSQYLIDQIEATPNIEVWSHTAVREIRGEGRVSSLVLDRAGSTVEVPAGAVFVFIGAAPFTEFLSRVVRLDDKGFILTGPDLGTRPEGWRLPREPFLLETSVPGIFAAGDARSGSSKRVAAAVGEGAVAVRFVHQYLASV